MALTTYYSPSMLLGLLRMHIPHNGGWVYMNLCTRIMMTRGPSDPCRNKVRAMIVNNVCLKSYYMYNDGPHHITTPHVCSSVASGCIFHIMVGGWCLLFYFLESIHLFYFRFLIFLGERFRVGIPGFPTDRCSASSS